MVLTFLINIQKDTLEEQCREKQHDIGFPLLI